MHVWPHLTRPPPNLHLPATSLACHPSLHQQQPVSPHPPPSLPPSLLCGQVCDHPALLSDRAAHNIVSGVNRARRQAAAALGGGDDGSEAEEIDGSSDEEEEEEEEWESGRSSSAACACAWTAAGRDSGTTDCTRWQPKQSRAGVMRLSWLICCHTSKLLLWSVALCNIMFKLLYCSVPTALPRRARLTAPHHHCCCPQAASPAAVMMSGSTSAANSSGSGAQNSSGRRERRRSGLQAGLWRALWLLWLLVELRSWTCGAALISSSGCWRRCTPLVGGLVVGVAGPCLFAWVVGCLVGWVLVTARRASAGSPACQDGVVIAVAGVCVCSSIEM